MQFVLQAYTMQVLKRMLTCAAEVKERGTAETLDTDFARLPSQAVQALRMDWAATSLELSSCSTTTLHAEGSEPFCYRENHQQQHL